MTGELAQQTRENFSNPWRTDETWRRFTWSIRERAFLVGGVFTSVNCKEESVLKVCKRRVERHLSIE
jgi:hypothetical protein